MIPVLKDLWDRESGGIVDSYSKTGREHTRPGRRFSFGRRMSEEDSVEAV